MKFTEQEILGENTACRNTFAMFSIGGDSINPGEITGFIGVAPTSAFAKGEEYLLKDGRKVKKPIGHWYLSSGEGVNSTSTEEHARYLLEILESKSEKIKKYINDQDLRVSFRFRWEGKGSHGGFSLSSDTLNRLCRLCNSIDYTFIGGEDEQDEDD